MTMNRILVDVGNTSVKWQLRSGGEIVNSGRGDVNALGTWLTEQEGTGSCVAAVSCVRDDDTASAIEAMLRPISGNQTYFAASEACFKGLSNAYAHPESLGVDRWLAMLAIKARGGESAIIIDAGTACTIDVLKSNQHVGGYIFPGTALSRDALLANTDKIRFSDNAEPSLAPGTGTAECVSSGVWLTVFAACQRVIDQNPGVSVYLTGGSAEELAALGLQGERANDLVFDGLDFWLNGA